MLRAITAVFISGFLATSVASPPLHAQVPTPAAQPANHLTTLHASTRIVYVDVVVRDGNGNIVYGLPEDRFTVLEDKHPQTISLFAEHKARPVEAASNGSSTTNSAQPAAGTISNIPHVEQDSPLDMVLLDLLDTKPVDQAYARQRMINFLRAMPPGHRVALFILSNGLHMVHDLSTDSGDLAKAAESINLKALDRVRTPTDQIHEHDYEASVQSPFLSHAIEEDLVLTNQGNMKVRLDATYQAFSELARAVNGFPGRKNLYWLAGEFPSDIYFTLQNLSANTVAPSVPGVGSAGNFAPGASGAMGANLALHPFSERINRALGDSQIAVYPISLTGVQTDNIGPGESGIGSANSGIGSAQGAAATTSSDFFNERSDDRVVMNHIADETGGQAFYGNNDPKSMLKQGFEDGDNYYTLAYEPTDANWNGSYRTIKVNLKPGGYHLSYRRGYFALPEKPVANVALVFAKSMRLETPPSTMLEISAVPPVAVSPGVLRLNATLDLHGVGFLTDPTAATSDRKAKLEVLLIAYPLDPSAKAAEINNALSLGLTSADYAKVLSSGIPIQQTLHLQPGKYALRLGVLDPVSGRIGTLTVPFTMPAA